MARREKKPVHKVVMTEGKQGYRTKRVDKKRYIR